MVLHESVSKVLNLLSSLADDTNDAINNTPYILRRLAEFTEGELNDLITQLEAIRDQAEELEEAHEKIQEEVVELQKELNEK
ncbi:putative nucleic acid-binding Zn-ribbon protein [Paenibacillus sp. 4624]